MSESEFEREALAKWKNKFDKTPAKDKKKFAEKHLDIICTHNINLVTGKISTVYESFECEGEKHHSGEKCHPI